MNFKNINPNELENMNPISMIGNDWTLITSGKKENFNTMTASWGGIGVLWNKNVAFCFIRPQRYTFEFMEKNDIFTLSFFKPENKNALKICGSKSGRNCNKIKEANLTPCFKNNAIYFEEAKMVLVCKKIYNQFISPDCIVDKKIEENYKTNDYHKMFVGEILECLVKK